MAMNGGQGVPCPYIKSKGEVASLVRAGTVTRPYGVDTHPPAPL